MHKAHLTSPRGNYKIARYAAIFAISEIVVFHEDSPTAAAQLAKMSKGKGKYRQTQQEFDADETLGRILQYLETPQYVFIHRTQKHSQLIPVERYLRRALFPMHPSLRLAGLLPPLDMPHHVRKGEQTPFRDGVVTASDEDSQTMTVDVGFDEPISLMGTAPTQTRVTVELQGPNAPRLVGPTYPTESQGIPWGYAVRLAGSISEALAPPGGPPYDLLIGLSERGVPYTSLPQPSSFPKYSRALIVLGGLAGLELSIESDPQLAGVTAEDAQDLFDHWVNICDAQGSRTIRTEEALGIGLAVLRERLVAAAKN